jgi:hypothetical protein
MRRNYGIYCRLRRRIEEGMMYVDEDGLGSRYTSKLR